ncbi:MAG: Uma2 family endonuclease [Pseudomonadota bacterium]
MSFARKTDFLISEEEYLSGELISEVRHEYIKGEVFAMAGASKNHNIISGNIFNRLYNELREKQSSCITYSSDMKAKVSDEINSYFYPDVMVVCEENEDDYYQNSAVIIVEVLSQSTSKYDKSRKRLSYFNIATLKEYVLIEQDKCEIVVFERDKGWQSSYYFLGDRILFKSIGLSLSVEDIYYQIRSEELTAYYKDKEQEEKQ